LLNFSAIRPDTLAGRIVRFPFRILPRDVAVPILQGPLRGRKWIVGSHLHGCWLGSYELKVQELMAKELKRGSVFYDVGANVGFYSLLAAVLLHPGRVYAFEPLPKNLHYLRRHVELNGIRNVETLELAISNQVGTALFETEETRAAGKLQTTGNVRVQTASLDALLNEERIAPPNYIKMDIEGTEFLALLGAKECLTRYLPRLFLATHGKDVHTSCCELLSSYNYEIEYIARESEDRAEVFAYSRS